MSKFRELRENINLDFVQLSTLLGLDPSNDFVGCDLQNLNLSNLDLTGFNFSGSNLLGCSWGGASVSGALFDDQTILDFDALRGAKDFSESSILVRRSLYESRPQARVRLLDCARALAIDWINDYDRQSALDPKIDKLLEALSYEARADLNRGDGRAARQFIDEVMGAVSLWNFGMLVGDNKLLCESVQSVMRSSSSPSGRASRIAKLLTVLMRIEIHIRRFDLAFPFGEENVLVGGMLEDILLSHDTDLSEVMPEVLLHVGTRKTVELLPVGLLFFGTVEKRDDRAVASVSGLGREFDLDVSLASPQWYASPPARGDLGAFTMRRNNKITQRGPKFVAAVLNLFSPSSDDELGSRVYLGASNSWAVVATTREEKQGLLANGGELARCIQRVCGLRRVTITSSSGSIESEIRNFVNDGYREIVDIELSDNGVWGRLKDGKMLLDHLALGESVYTHRKVRTFLSMWQKIFPDLEIFVSIGSGRGFGTRQFRELVQRNTDLLNDL